MCKQKKSKVRATKVKHTYISRYVHSQGRPSRGFQGGMCTPAFLPSPGNSYIRKKIVHAFYFPRNSPPHAPLLPRPDGRPCVCISCIIGYHSSGIRGLCLIKFPLIYQVRTNKIIHFKGKSIKK